MAKDCELEGKTHDWKEKTEWYSPYSTQPVGKTWVCKRCGIESDTKPTTA